MRTARHLDSRRKRLIPFSIRSLFPAALLLMVPTGPSVADPSPDRDATFVREQLPAAADLLPEATSDDGRVSLFVEGDPDPRSMVDLGAELGTTSGPMRVVRLPAANLAAFLRANGNRRVQLARMLTPLLNVSVPTTGAPSLWGSNLANPPIYSGYSGKNVVIGIVDTGIDFTHQDFANPITGKTRILNLWDQTVPAYNPPSGFTYGRVWTNTEIDAGSCTQTDGDGHGTFIASIAGGNGKATTLPFLPFRYIGVAPEADLVIVKTKGLSTDIVDGVNYVFQRAAQLGKDAVACISFGTQAGPHDGTDPMEQALNGLSGPGKIICAAAGNDGADSVHAAASVSSGTAIASFSVPVHSSGGGQRVLIEGWYPAGKSVSISLRSPSGSTTIGPVARGASLNQDTSQGTFTIYNGTVTSSRGDYQISINARSGASDLAAGTWTIQLTTTTPTTNVDFWVTSFYLLSSGTPKMMTGVSSTKTIVTPATADSVLSAGAYCTRASWTAKNGTTYGFTGAVLNDSASWSSRGPDRNGRVLPDVSGPGFGVGAALSKWSSVSSIYILDDGLHAIRQGTSASAAHMAGIVALMMQRQRATTNKALTVGLARSLLHSGALSDSYTNRYVPVPNYTWGYGKLHIGGSTQVGVDEAALARFGFAAPYPNPARHSAAFSFDLASADLAGANGPIEIQILDLRGRLVARLRGPAEPGPQSLSWNLADLHGSRVSPGIYFARITVGEKSAIRKLAVLNP
jgi:subtilisin family serine protease